MRWASPIGEAERRVGLIRHDFSHGLAMYVRSVLAGDSPYDRFITRRPTALTAQQQHGLQLFRGRANARTAMSARRPVFMTGGPPWLGASWWNRRRREACFARLRPELPPCHRAPDWSRHR
jgi:hypothetical protein